MQPSIDPLTGLTTSQASYNRANQPQSSEQLKKTLRLFCVADSSQDASMQLHTVISRERCTKRVRKASWMIKAQELVLHNELLHIIICLLISICGWAFESSVSEISINMTNFIVLLIYLPLFIHSSFKATWSASEAMGFRQTTQASLQRPSLKDIVLNLTSKSFAQDSHQALLDACEPIRLSDDMLQPTRSVTLLQPADDQPKLLKMSGITDISGVGNLVLSDQIPAFQMWNIARPGGRGMQLNLEDELHIFLKIYLDECLNKLTDPDPTDYLVVRDGQITVVSAWNIVVGDILVLTEGRIVPCDCAILPVYFTQKHALPAFLFENLVQHSELIDSQERLHPFCPTAVSYGLARKQPSVFCQFPAETAIRIIIHYNIHALHQNGNRSRARHGTSQNSNANFTDSASALLARPSVPQEMDIAFSESCTSRTLRSSFGSTFFSRDSAIRSALPFYTKSLGLQDSVHTSTLSCGYRIIKIKNSSSIYLENISIGAVLDAFVAYLYEQRKIKEADLSKSELGRLSALCAKILTDAFDGRRVSPELVNIFIGKGIRVRVTAVGNDVTIIKQTENLAASLQEPSLDHSLSDLKMSRRQKRPPKVKMSHTGLLLEGKDDIVQRVYIPSAFLSAMPTIEHFFRILSIISFCVSITLIVMPIVPQIIVSPELRAQYLNYWDSSQTNQNALFSNGFVPTFCSALVFGLISGLFLHNSIIYLRPFLSLSAQYLSSLGKRDMHMHTLGGLEAISFMNTLVIDESLLFNMSGNQAHRGSPEFWDPVVMKLTFVYMTGENTAERLYYAEDLRFHGSTLSQDIVMPFCLSVTSNLRQLDPNTGQFTAIGLQKNPQKNLNLKYSRDEIESTEQIDHPCFKHCAEDLRANASMTASKQPWKLYDMSLCFMRFLLCVTMEPGDASHILQHAASERTIFTPDYAFTVPVSPHSSITSEATSSIVVSRENLCSWSSSVALSTPKNSHLTERNVCLFRARSPSNGSKPPGGGSCEAFRDYLYRCLALPSALSLKTIRATGHSAVVRRYGRLITSGCLQDSHVSVSQVHPLLTDPLRIYLVYLEGRDPLVVVKCSSPDYLLSLCDYLVVSPPIYRDFDAELHTFSLSSSKGAPIFCYRRITDVDRQRVVQKLDELGKSCHELVLYAVSDSTSAESSTNWMAVSRGDISQLSLIYVGVAGFRALQKEQPATFITQFTELTNGANLVITTHRSFTSAEKLGASTTPGLNQSRGACTCTDPTNDMGTLLRALHLEMQDTQVADSNAHCHRKNTNWHTSNTESDHLLGSILECESTTAVKTQHKRRDARRSPTRQMNVLVPQMPQVRRCLVTSDLKAISLYTLSRMRDNRGQLLLSQKLARMRKREHSKTSSHSASKVSCKNEEAHPVASRPNPSSRFADLLDSEGESELDLEDEKSFYSAGLNRVDKKYQQRALQLACNYEAYLSLKNSQQLDTDVDASDPSIIAPSQTWQAIRCFLNNNYRPYNIPKKRGKRPLLYDTDMSGEQLPNIFIVPQSSPIETASNLSKMGAFVTLVLPNMPPSQEYTITESMILQDNVEAREILQNKSNSRSVPTHLAVLRDKVSFLRKPDFLIVGYSRKRRTKQGIRDFGVSREDYMKLRSSLPDCISVASISGRFGLQWLRNIALETPHFFFSIFPVFIGAIRTRLLQGIFPLIIVIVILVEITLECMLYGYEMATLGIRPWYYPPTAVGIILLTGHLFNEGMIPLMVRFSLKLHTNLDTGPKSALHAAYSKIAGSLLSLVARCFKCFKKKRSTDAGASSVTRLSSRDALTNTYHLEALMNVAENLSHSLQKSSLIVFTVLFIIISVFILIPSINYRYYGSWISLRLIQPETYSLFASTLSQKFVTFTTVLMVLLFITFSSVAFFSAFRMPMLKLSGNTAQRCFKISNVLLFFSIQFFSIYVFILTPIKLPVISILLSGFKLNEEDAGFWSGLLFSIGISCLVLIVVILKQMVFFSNNKY